MSDDEEAAAVEPTRKQQGPYELVGLKEDEEEDCIVAPDLWHRNWIPDHWYSIYDVEILDGVEAVRLLKFTAITVLAVVVMFHLARFMDWEHDANFSLQDMLLFDAGNMMLDVMVFFVVGRLYKHKGVDHLAWTLTTLMASIYTSCSYTFGFLQHSVSLYDMHCHWPWSLWFYFVAALLISTAIIALHVQYARQHKLVMRKLVELTLAASVWLVPQMSHPNFHFHHWFAGWLVGMQFNFDTWWSRMAMAWCWGQYINGVSTWGRDPQLTCAYAYYMSVDQYCPYMKCFQEQVTVHPPWTNVTYNQTVYKALSEPDWKNCSAEGNYNP